MRLLVGTPRMLPTPRLLTSLRRFAAFLRPIFSASFLPGWRPQRSSARMCPRIPRGHLAMCPQPAASLIIHTSSTRFRHDAYESHVDLEISDLVAGTNPFGMRHAASDFRSEK